MSGEFLIQAQPRAETGKGASRRLRRAGLVPAILYGGHEPPEMLSIPHNVLIRQLDNEAFYSHILDLRIGDLEARVVLKDLQRHPAKPFILHADFQRVTQGEKLRMTVPIHFVNEDKCRGIKIGGQVSHTITEVEITCLPQDLPEFLAVDMTNLEIGGIVHLSEIPMPPGVALAHQPDPDEPVVVIHGARGGDDESEPGSGT